MILGWMTSEGQCVPSLGRRVKRPRPAAPGSVRCGDVYRAGSDSAAFWRGRTGHLIARIIVVQALDGIQASRFDRGQTPKIRPTATETTKPVITAQRGIVAGSEGTSHMIR